MYSITKMIIMFSSSSKMKRDEFILLCKRMGLRSKDGYILHTADSPLKGVQAKIKCFINKEGGVGLYVRLKIYGRKVGEDMFKQIDMQSICNWIVFDIKLLLLNDIRVSAIEFQDPKIQSINLRYLLLCKGHEDAVVAHNELFERGYIFRESICNDYKNVAVWDTEDDNNFIGFYEERDSDISSRVIDVQSKNLCEKQYNCLRVDINLCKRFIQQNVLNDPRYWQKEENIYADGLRMIRKYFHLDEMLCTVRPSQSDINQFSTPAQELLNAYFDGKNVEKQELLTNMGRDVYIAVKKRFIETIGINISIPWKVQCMQLSPRLGNLLTVANCYCIQ